MTRDPTAEVEELAEALVRMKLAYPYQLRGCDEEEVARVVDATRGFPLPEHYLAFLLRLGREAGRLLVGTDVYYPAVLDVPDWAAEFAAEDAPDLRVEGRHFFGSHQGYQYYFFDRDSPGEVFLYTEGDPAPVSEGATFMEFLWRHAHLSSTCAYGGKYPS